jgi:hypothetical protein
MPENKYWNLFVDDWRSYVQQWLKLQQNVYQEFDATPKLTSRNKL